LIERYICEIDKNPIICTNPFEETSYLGLHYTKNRVLYRAFFGDFIKQYKDYIQEFVQSNQSSPEAYEYVDTTLTWLLNKFKNAHKQITNSPLRIEWSMIKSMPELTKIKTDGEWTIHGPNTIREAFLFFNTISTIQKNLLKELIDFITDQLLPIKIANKAIAPNRMTVGNVGPEIVYVFRLTKTATKNANTILNLIYTGLAKNGYIKCSSRDFKKLFIDYSHDKPQKSPSPIIWHCKPYNHLAYFIYCLIENDIIFQKKRPSNYRISIHLFNDRNENIYYHPKKERYDGHINPNDQAKIDSIIEKSSKD
jgi:hypothetical protein